VTRSTLTLFISATLLTLAAIAWLAYSWSHGWNVATQPSDNPLLDVALAIGMMAVSALSALPAELIASGNGVLFGPWVGFVITWVGAMLGSAIAFLLARKLGFDGVRDMLKPHHIQRFDALTERYGARALLVIRLVPLIPFFVVNFTAGLSTLPFSRFMLVTGIGIIPVTALCVWFGAGLSDGQWLWPLMLFIAIVALGWLLRKHLLARSDA